MNKYNTTFDKIYVFITTLGVLAQVGNLEYIEKVVTQVIHAILLPFDPGW